MSESRQRIAARADGVPLFAEELLRDRIDVKYQGSQSIPVRLRDTLTSCLDGLGLAREIARIAAVLGREAPSRELALIMALAEKSSDEDLKRLVETGILVER